MKLEEKLQVLRKKNGYSQEQLADELGVARQTISKWETGQTVPELSVLIALSELYGVSIDRIVKDDKECNLAIRTTAETDYDEMAAFLIRAKHSTYAGKGQEVAASRTASHDYAYEEDVYAYYDTYLGGERFAGEEAMWYCGNPVWSMNYAGRVVGEHFDLDFLREALYHVPHDKPYRGPEIYTKGDYHYHCRVDGDITWYQGYEDIFYRNSKIYECYFHGGVIR